MRWILVMTGVLMISLLAQEELPPEETAPKQEEIPEPVDLELPEWQDVELDALESGEYIPGSGLMGRLAREVLDSEEQEVIELDPVVLDLPEEVLEPGESSTIIRPEFISDYFHRLPSGFLNDPQKLLVAREFRDRDRFLNMHARDFGTDIDYYLYLFDEEQELPEGESLEALVKSKFNQEQKAAVVFYYFGNPGRAQLVFTEQVMKTVSRDESEKVLRMSIEEAMEKTDPSAQLDSFSIQLSKRLYWLDKVVAKGGDTLLGSQQLLFPSDGSVSDNEGGLWEKLVANEVLFYGLMVAGILIPGILIGLLVRWISEKRRIYLFPDAQGAPLLEAPHAAGVGGVLSFASTTAPPSSQKKKDGPDYLQKM